MPWPDEAKRAFLRQQFEAQDAYWKEHYHSTSWDVVLFDGELAGRLYVARWKEEIRIVDIALLSAFRGQGIGTELLRRLSEEADAVGKPLSIHMEVHSPARSLYERMGFRDAEDRGVYVLMRRDPLS